MSKKLIIASFIAFICFFAISNKAFAATVSYSPSNFSVDTNSTLFGGSNIQIINGVATLNWNRPAVDSNHIGYFRFNDSGSSATDDSSNHNTGSFGTATTYVNSDGTYAGAGAAKMNAVGSANILVGNHLAYEYTQPWTVMAAVKQNGAPATASVIFTNVPSDSVTNKYPGYEFWIDSSSHLHVRIIHDFSLNQYIGVSGSTNVADNHWHYVTATYDGSGSWTGVKLYVDGTAETLTEESDTLGGGSTIWTGTGGNPYTIGNQQGSWLTQFNIKGSLDEFIEYNVVKSSTFISSHSSPSSVPSCDSDCVLNYHFDEGSGTTVHDSSSNGFNATASDTSILTPGFYGQGGQALALNGTDNSYATFPQISAYNLGTTFTLSSWANSFVSGSSAVEALFKHVDNNSPFPGWGLLSGYTGSSTKWWDGGAFRDTTYTVQPGWHNYTIRFNSGTLDFFVDGTNVKSLTGISTPSSASVPLLIGAWPQVGDWNGDISTTTLSNTNRSDSYIAQFSKVYPANGVVSLSTPSASVSSGGGNFGQTVNITNLSATYTSPNTSKLEYRIGVGSTAAAATSNKQSQSYTQLASSNSLSLSGQYVDYDIRLDPSTDTIASSSPSLSSVTLSYSTSSGPTVPGTPSTATPTNNNTPTWTWTASTSSNGLATPPYTVQYSQDSSFSTGVTTNTASTNSYTIPSALSDGTWYLRVKATDSLGQSSAYSSNGSVVVDTVVPTTPGTPTTTSPSSTATPTWTWTASADSGSGLAFTPYIVQWSQDSTFATGVSSATSTTNFYTHTTGLSNGTWYFKVRATDVAGNNSSYSSVGSVVINVTSVSTITIDNATGSGTGFTQTGTWTHSTSATGYYGTDYQHDGNTNKGSDTATWTPSISTSGTYDVFISYTSSINRATNVPITIAASDGNHPYTLDETSGGNGTWMYVGTYSFNSGTSGYVQMSNTGTNGYVIADAVKFVYETGASNPSIVDNGGTGYTETGSSWTHSTSATGYYGTDYEHDNNTNKGSDTAKWIPNLSTYGAGTYDVFINYTSGSNRATNVPVTIVGTGTNSYTLNQQIGGSWKYVGTYSFNATGGYVQISNASTNGYVVSDAVKFVYVSP